MPILQFDDIEINTSQIELRRNGVVLDLEPKSFRVLMYLVDNRARVVPKEELVQKIWNGAFVTDNALTRSIAQIRKAIGDDARQARFIETVPTVGYRFIGNIRELNLPAPAEPPSVLAPPPRSHTRLILIALALVAISIASFLALRRNQPPRRLHTLQLTTGPGLDSHPSFSPDGSSVVYASDRNGPFELYIRQLAKGGREIQLTTDGKDNIEPAWSPSGADIAYTSVKERGIFIISSLGGAPRRLTGFGSQPTWSPDGSRIVFRSEGHISLAISDMPPNRQSVLWSISAEGGTPQALTSPSKLRGRPTMPCFSPDRNYLGFLLIQPTGPALVEMNLQTGKFTTVPTDGIIPQSFAYGPDGATAYFVGASRKTPGIAIYKLSRDPKSRQPTAEPDPIVTTDFVVYREPAVSPRGDKLAYAATTMVGNLWQVTPGGETKPLINERTFRVTAPVFSPNGEKIAYLLRRRGEWGNIFASNADGSNPVQLTKQESTNYMPSWTPDSQGVAFATVRENTPALYLYSMRDGSERKLTDLRSSASYGSQGVPVGRLSPDGKSVLFQSDVDGILQVWKMDLATRKQVQLTSGPTPSGYPVWSPDGRDVVFELLEGEFTNAAIVPADGGPVRRITNERGHVWPFSFSPDRRELAAAVKLEDAWNIYAVDLATGKLRKITDNQSLRVFLRYPSWSPRGDRIAFERNETTGNVYLTELH